MKSDDVFNEVVIESEKREEMLVRDIKREVREYHIDSIRPQFPMEYWHSRNTSVSFTNRELKKLSELKRKYGLSRSAVSRSRIEVEEILSSLNK